MKRNLILFLPLLMLLSSCTSPIGRLERVWPDGASVTLKKFNLTVSMTGAGSLTADEVRWTGTNGFPIPGVVTNAAAK